jgi:hypothetical protein
MSDVSITVVAMFLTLLVGLAAQVFLQWYHWQSDLKAQEVLAVKVEKDAVALTEHVEERTEAVVDTLKSETAKLQAAIEENTEISTKAFHEANTVNLKLEKLGIEHARHEEKEDQQDAAAGPKKPA